MKQINIGNVNRPAGYYKFKTRAADGRNESPVSMSPEFTRVNTTPAPPTLLADDVADTLTVSHELGDSEILVSVDGGPWVPLSELK